METYLELSTRQCLADRSIGNQEQERERESPKILTNYTPGYPHLVRGEIQSARKS